MKLSIHQKVFENFPDLTVGVLAVQGLDNTRGKSEAAALLADAVKEARSSVRPDTLPDDERLTAWREAYRSFGAKPKKYKCSIENLYRMILGGTELRSINPIVDIYNSISLKYGLPAGGDDIDKVDGDIELTYANGDEQFIPLGSSENSPPKEGEVVYRDSKEILCRRWNWRECDKSKMTEETQNALLVLEGLPPFQQTQIEEILSDLENRITTVCGGSATKGVLNSAGMVFEF